MDSQLLQTVESVVNSRVKLDVLYYFHRNPHTWESLSGLGRRLHRAPADLEGAVRELATHGLLRVRSTRAESPELLFSYVRPKDEADIRRLLEAYGGAGRREVLQAVAAQDEQTRLRAVAGQRALDDMRTRFVSMVTHELRTPVTVIKGVLKTLSASPQVQDANLKSLVERAERQSERLSSMVENLLVLSGLQSGRHLELYLAEVDLPRLIKEIYDQFRSEEDSRDLKLSVEAAPATIVADEYLLGQLLGELISNALKFSPQSAPVRIEAKAEGDSALIAVDDAGVGVPAQHQEQVFRAFFQSEPDSSRMTGGMGLGLFMARKIVEAHGGRIWLEPKPPPGVRVCIALPLSGPGARGDQV